jgi:putative glutamine amidotransferase
VRPRIAIPTPHSQKPDYNQRSLPDYIAAVEKSGGEAVVIPAGASNAEIARTASTCQGVLLPGSPADVDPQKFAQPRNPKTNDADPARDNLDELLLQDAYNMRKPVFGICYGLQSLNVWRTGTLVQHIESKVDHEIGRKAVTAHVVDLEPASRLAKVITDAALAKDALPVNSSHHQSADVPGDGLRVVAKSPNDGVIEALEGTDAKHWVLAVQWHPERNMEADKASQALFRDFISAAANYQPKSPDREDLGAPASRR